MTTFQDPQPHSRRAAREAERAAREAAGVENALPEDFDDSEVRPRPTGRRARLDEGADPSETVVTTDGRTETPARPAEPAAYDSSPFLSAPTPDAPAEPAPSGDDPQRFRPRDFSPEGRRAVVPAQPTESLAYRTLGASPLTHPSDQQTGDLESTVVRPERAPIALGPIPTAREAAEPEPVIEATPESDAGAPVPEFEHTVPAAGLPAAAPAETVQDVAAEPQRPLTRRELRRLEEAAAAAAAAQDDAPAAAAAQDDAPADQIADAQHAPVEDLPVADASPLAAADADADDETSVGETPADETPADDSVVIDDASPASASTPDASLADASAAYAPTDDASPAAAADSGPTPLVEPEPITSSREAISHGAWGADVLQNLQSSLDFPFVPRTEPIIEEVAPEAVVAEEPLVEIPVPLEPVDETPAEPVADSPVADEPVAEEPVAAAEHPTEPEPAEAPVPGPVEAVAERVDAFDAMLAASGPVDAEPMDAGPLAFAPPAFDDEPSPDVTAAPSWAGQSAPVADPAPVEETASAEQPARIEEPAPIDEPALVEEPESLDFPPPGASSPAPEAAHPMTDPFGVIPSAPFIDPAPSDGPSPFVEPPVQRASYTPPPGHWSRQADLDDAEQPFENTLSRDVGGGGSVTTTTSALILPAIPQADFAHAIESTGEILVTGSINLPHGFATTGIDSRAIDAPDVDRMFEALDGEVVSMDSQPVRAIRAVSTHTATQGVIVPPRKARGNRWIVVACIVTAALALAVTGMLAAFLIIRP